MQIIDKLIIVHPVTRTWGGKKKLDPSDINYNPPADLVSLGNKRIVPKATLRPFESFKKWMERTMLRFGVRLIGGYAVAEDNIDALTEKLKEFELEFDQLKADFVQNFNRYVDEQVGNYPEWETSIRAAASEVATCLEDKFECGYKAYKLIPPGSQQDNGQEDINDKFIHDDEFLAQAAMEIAKMADKSLVRLSGQEQIRPVSLGQIKVIREKLMNLSSLDRTFFGKAVFLIDMVLGEMPPKGYIEGRARKMLTSLLLLLRTMNEEPQKTELLAGSYDDPDSLVKAMGYGDAPNSPESGEDSPDAQEEDQEEPEKEEELVWF